MGRLLRRYSKGEVYFISNRTAVGLPFVPNKLINTFIKGIMARALALNPGITLCGYVFMGNHYHLIIVLDASGSVLKSFMEYLDGEIAKVINRFRGKCNQNVWAKPYDCQVILTPESVMEKLKYLYLNPAQSGLIDSISKYPGVNSWKEMMKNKSKLYRFFGSANLTKLPLGPLSNKLMNSIIEEKSKSKKFQEKNPLRIDPFAWVRCFKSYKDKDIELLKKELIKDIKKEERKLKSKRAGKPVLGAKKLIEQCFHKYFISKKYGKRSPCISSCLETRSIYLATYIDFVERCKKAYFRFKETFIHVDWPPGAFPPPSIPRSSLVQIEI